jgi:hypothetical protein
MQFSAGSAELGPPQLDYGAKLATVLTERPSLHLELCGESGRDDYAGLAPVAGDSGGGAVEGSAGRAADTAAPVAESELRPLMLALAEERADSLKRWLVTERGIEAKRLNPCKPAADPQGEVNGVRLAL